MQAKNCQKTQGTCLFLPSRFIRKDPSEASLAVLLSTKNGSKREEKSKNEAPPSQKSLEKREEIDSSVEKVREELRKATLSLATKSREVMAEKGQSAPEEGKQTGFFVSGDINDNEVFLTRDDQLGLEQYTALPGLTFFETQYLNTRDQTTAKTSAFSLAFYARVYSRILENLASRIDNGRASGSLTKTEQDNMVRAANTFFVRVRDRIAKLQSKDSRMAFQVIVEENVLHKAEQAIARITTDDSIYLLEESTEVPTELQGPIPPRPESANITKLAIAIPQQEVPKTVTDTRASITLVLGSLESPEPLSATQSLGSISYSTPTSWTLKKPKSKKE